MITPAVENELKKAESIIEVSKNLLAHGIMVDFSRLNKITSNLQQVIYTEYADKRKYAGILQRMNDINVSIDNLVRRQSSREETKNDV